MVAIQRNVQLKSFRVVESSLEFLEIDIEETDSKTPVFVDFDAYDINVDYQVGEEPDTLALTMSIAVNGVDEPEHGYSIYVLGMMVFEVEDPEYGHEEDRDYESEIQDAVELGIGAIRGYMMSLTSYGLLGPYTLPNFDLEDFDDEFDSEDQDDDDLDHGVRSLNPDR